MNSFLGAFALLLSLIFIPEIKQKKKYVIGVLGLIIILVGLGIDKTNRDNVKDEKNAQQRKTDSLTIDSLKTDLRALAIEHGNDTIRWAKIERTLLDSFHIDISNGTPTKVTYTYNTHFRDAGTVNIGR